MRAAAALVWFTLGLAISSGASSFLNMAESDSRQLAQICNVTTLADENFFFDQARNLRAEKGALGVAEVNVMALYTELAKRSAADDTDARRALTLAMLRGDRRAREAKLLALANLKAKTSLETEKPAVTPGAVSVTAAAINIVAPAKN